MHSHVSESSGTKITFLAVDLFLQSVKKQTKHPCLFQYKLTYRNETGINIMDYCVLQFDALKFFLEVPLHGGSMSNFNSFSVNLQI